ncbi:MAG TPA: hypothetical protein VH814_05195 [Steroidobacteraceae bacterium]|jgi:hypothetical protein
MSAALRLRDRDEELDRLVAAEIDAFVELPGAVAPTPAPAPATISLAELDFVELVRAWLERRPNRQQLLDLMCDGLRAGTVGPEVRSEPEPPREAQPTPDVAAPEPPPERESHAAS